MSTHTAQRFFGICRKAADKVSSLNGGRLPDHFSDRFHHHDTLESSPSLFLHQPLNIFCCPTASPLDASVILLDALCKLQY